MTSEEIRTELMLLGFKESTKASIYIIWSIELGSLKVAYNSTNFYIITAFKNKQESYWFGKDVLNRVIDQLKRETK